MLLIILLIRDIIISEGHDEILELSKKNNYDDLTYHFKGKNICEKCFNDFDNAMSLFKKIKNGNIMQKKLKWV